jgi:hypothetical protein
MVDDGDETANATGGSYSNDTSMEASQDRNTTATMNCSKCGKHFTSNKSNLTRHEKTCGNKRIEEGGKAAPVAPPLYSSPSLSPPLPPLAPLQAPLSSSLSSLPPTDVGACGGAAGSGAALLPPPPQKTTKKAAGARPHPSALSAVDLTTHPLVLQPSKATPALRILFLEHRPTFTTEAAAAEAAADAIAAAQATAALGLTNQPSDTTSAAALKVEVLSASGRSSSSNNNTSNSGSKSSSSRSSGRAGISKLKAKRGAGGVEGGGGGGGTEDDGLVGGKWLLGSDWRAARIGALTVTTTTTTTTVVEFFSMFAERVDI